MVNKTITTVLLMNWWTVIPFFHPQKRKKESMQHTLQCDLFYGRKKWKKKYTKEHDCENSFTLCMLHLFRYPGPPYNQVTGITVNPWDIDADGNTDESNRSLRAALREW